MKGYKKSLDNQALSDVLSQMDVKDSHDIGCAMVNVGFHPTLGSVLLVQGIGSQHLLIDIARLSSVAA